jgi:hypothetical protein
VTYTVGDEEDRDCKLEVVAVHAELVFHTEETGIANVDYVLVSICFW